MIPDAILVIGDSQDSFLAQNISVNDTQSEFQIKHANREF